MNENDKGGRTSETCERGIDKSMNGWDGREKLVLEAISGEERRVEKELMDVMRTRNKWTR